MTMILTCENCDSRYHIDQDSLGPGRSVRCTSCQYIWFQKMPSEGQENHLSQPAVSPSQKSRRLRWISLWFFFSILTACGVSWGWHFAAPYWIYLRDQVRVISGFLASNPPESLEIFRLSPPQMNYLGQKDGLPQVRVAGSITNTSSQVQPLPAVKVHLWGPKYESDGGLPKEHPPLETRSYSLGQSHLLPGEVLDYSFDLVVDPSMTSTSVGF